jgi:hypothetical protein
MAPTTKRGRSGVEPRVRRLAGNAAGGPADLLALVRQAIFSQHIGGTAEGIGRDQIGPGVEIGLVYPPDDVRTREVQVLVAALERGAAEILGREIARLDHRSHGAVEHEDALAERRHEARATLWNS